LVAHWAVLWEPTTVAKRVSRKVAQTELTMVMLWVEKLVGSKELQMDG
jgi:hypothetical protein